MARKTKILTHEQLIEVNEGLQRRLEEAEETLRAIHNGEVDALIISGPDGEQIFPLKKAKEALEESEANFRMLVEEVNDGFYVMDTEGVFTFANSALVRIFGVESVEKLVGRKYLDFVAPEMLTALSEALRSTMQTGSAPEFISGKIVRPDGTRAFIEDRPVTKVKGGQVTGSQGVVRDITERKRAEEALRESEAEFRGLFENSMTGISQTLPDGTLLRANLAYTRMYGYANPEEMMAEAPNIGQRYANPKDRKEVLRVLADKGVMEPREMAVLHRNGTRFFVLVGTREIRDSDGKVLRYQAEHVDITERKQAEENLRLSEEKYRTLIDEVNDGFYVTDKAGVFTFANPALARMYGVESAQALIGRKFTDFIAPNMFSGLSQEQRSTMQSGHAPQVINGQIVRQDGTRAFLEIKPVSIVKKNQVIGSRGVVRDVTERKQAEEAQRESEERFRSLYENVPIGIYRTSIDGQILLANPALVHMLKYENFDEMACHNLEQEGFEPEYPRSEFIQRMKSEGEVMRLESHWKRKDGTLIFVSESAKVIRDNDANDLYYEGTVEDITERKNSEMRIQRQLEHLTALSAIDRIIASVFDLRLSLSEILNHVTRELGVDAADILTLNPNSHMLEFAAENGFRTSAIRKTQIRLGESYAGRAALERKLVQIPNLSDEPKNPLLTNLLAGEDFVCYYGVPLIAKGQIKGVMEVYHRAALNPDSEWIDFLNTLAGQAAIAIENSTLFESLQRSNSELNLAYDATIEGWSHALDLRDKETEGHTQRVTEMTVKLAGKFGLSEAELAQVRWGALLHDIGKMGVPDGLLHKPGPLTDEEWVVMKQHTTFAYEMLAPIRYLRLALDIPYCHHEKWDGSGYPRGLKGEQIPLVARIFAVVDVWDALTSDRPYRLAWPEDKVREHIQASSGTHFDPQVVSEFLQPASES